MNSSLKNILKDPLVISMALISVIIHLVLVNHLEYHRDELLYFSLGLHPSAGYNSVPPLIGWIAFIMQNIFGFSVFAVRLFPAILGGALILLVAALTLEAGGSRYAAFLSSVGLLISIFFQRTYFLFQPVHIEIFLWTLIIYLVVKYINTRNNNILIVIGVVAGIALLNKYMTLLLLLGLFITIPFTEYRYVLRERKFFAGLAAGFIIFLPNLIWQFCMGLPVFNHLSALYDTQLVHMDVPLFLTEQLIMPFAGSFFTIAGLIFILGSEETRKYRFLGYVSIIVIMALLFLKGKSYYTLGIFPFLIGIGAVAYEKWIVRSSFRTLFPAVLIIVTLPVIPIGIPVFKTNGMIKYFDYQAEKLGIDLGRRFEDGSIHSLPQDYADMLGWEELAAITDKAYRMVKDKDACIIFGGNYGQAGAITVIGKKYRLPQAISFSESFQYWYPKRFDPDVTSIVLIEYDEPGDDVKALFRKITRIGSISNPDAREFGTSVYLCEEPVRSFNQFWEERTGNLY
ncbi:MAG TPA: glycosyltransferase family 39 protein [Bacteroidales bacterium]|nr:glycosyltransferase family 39 protein [Bacteroidales bacterium]